MSLAKYLASKGMQALDKGEELAHTGGSMMANFAQKHPGALAAAGAGGVAAGAIGKHMEEERDPKERIKKKLGSLLDGLGI